MRKNVFLCFAAVLFSFLIWGMLGLSAFGNYPGPYGDILNSIAVSERHVLNVVTAVMFDYRGFDTLGEEFILFAAVTGVTLLLRNDSEENCAPKSKLAQTGPEMISAQTTDAARFFTLPFIGLIIVFGIYVVLTGHLSVGGGFQGGVILSSAWLLIYFAYGSVALRRVSNHFIVEFFESGGAGLYAIIGAVALFFGKNFLANVLPLGQTGQLLSSGTILLINCAVGTEVAAGFLLLYCEFIKPLENPEDNP